MVQLCEFSPVSSKSELMSQFLLLLILREISTRGWRGRNVFSAVSKTDYGTELNDFFYQALFWHFLEMTRRDNKWVYFSENISWFQKGVTDKGSWMSRAKNGWLSAHTHVREASGTRTCTRRPDALSSWSLSKLHDIVQFIMATFPNSPFTQHHTA